MQSIARTRVPPRCDPGQRRGTVWQPTSLPAVRSTATFLAHAMARAQYDPTKFTSVWSAPGSQRARLLFEYSVWVSKFANEQDRERSALRSNGCGTDRYEIKGYCGQGFAVCELVHIRRNFFLAGVSPYGTKRTRRRSSGMSAHRVQNRHRANRPRSLLLTHTGSRCYGQ